MKQPRWWVLAAACLVVSCQAQQKPPKFFDDAVEPPPRATTPDTTPEATAEPQANPSAGGFGEPEAYDPSQGAPAAGELASSDSSCLEDSDCALTYIQPSGDMQCCSGCSARVVSLKALEATKLACAEPEFAGKDCPLKKCASTEPMRAACVEGTCMPAPG
jgi:hypothetical protein